MRFTLGHEPDTWNDIARINSTRSFVERTTTRRVYRELAAELPPAQLRVLLFIMGRTFGWQKYAEAIPMQHFLNGFVNGSGELVRDEHGAILCAGSGVAKDETVRKATRALEDGGLITVFRGARHTITPANIYMPLQVDELARLIVAGGDGVLPSFYPGILKGELVVVNGEFWSVVSVVGTYAKLKPAMANRRPPGDYSCDTREIRRVAPREWIAFAEQEKKDKKDQ